MGGGALWQEPRLQESFSTYGVRDIDRALQATAAEIMLSTTIDDDQTRLVERRSTAR
jgi:hypothetical protein